MPVQTVSFTKSDFSFITLPAFYEQEIDRIHGEYDPSKKQGIPVTYEHIEKYASDKLPVIDAFLKLFPKEQQEKIKENLFGVIYQNDSLVWFSTPTIVKVKREISLVIGVNVADYVNMITIPLMIGEKIKLNKNDLELSFYEINDKNDVSDPPRKIKVPVFAVRSGDFVFNLILKTNTDYWDLSEILKSDSIEQKRSQLLNVMQFLYGASCSISYMFRELFRVNRFPPTGIVLKVTNLTVVELDSSNGRFKIFKASIDSKNLPPILVVSSEPDEKGNRNTQLVPLDKVTCIDFSATHNLAKSSGNLPLPTIQEPWYLWIKGQGRSIDTVPQHQVYGGNYIPDRIKKLAEASTVPQYWGGMDSDACLKLKEDSQKLVSAEEVL